MIPCFDGAGTGPQYGRGFRQLNDESGGPDESSFGRGRQTGCRLIRPFMDTSSLTMSRALCVAPDQAAQKKRQH
jgi:hypothetical protein